MEKHEDNKKRREKKKGSQRVAMDVDDNLTGDCPEDSWFMCICFPLKLFYVWIIPYVAYFFFKPARLQVLPKLSKKDRVETIEKRFNFWWDFFSERKSNKSRRTFLSIFPNCCFCCCQRCFVMIPGVKIVTVIMFTFGVGYWLSFFIMLGVQIELIFLPKAMQKFLELLAPKLSLETETDLDIARRILPPGLRPKENSELGFRTNDYEIWLWLLVLLFLLGSSMIFMELSYYLSIRVGMNVRTVLQSRIFGKSLKLSSKSRVKYENGVIMNYASLDLFKIELVFQMMNYGITSYSLLIGSLYYLIDLIDWGTLTGSSALLIFLPMSVCAAVFYIGIMAMLKKTQEKRISSINEIIQGIRIIKFFTWEKSYSKKISGIRKIETFLLRLMFLIFALIFSFFSSLSTIVSVFAFMTYYLVHGHLSAIVIFTSLTYFNMLKFPLMTAPMTIMLISDMLVSLARIEKYLSAEELRTRDDVFEKTIKEEKKNISSSEKDDEEEKERNLPAIEIKNGEFKWDSDSKDIKKILKKRMESEIKNLKEENQKKLERMMVRDDNISKEEIKKEKLRLKEETKKLKKKWKLLIKQFKKNLTDSPSSKTTTITKDEEENNEIIDGMKDLVGRLTNINFEAPKGSLIMIFGNVGSGKSSLLSAILGEMKEESSSSVKIRGKISYTNQTSWMQNETLKENVLFGDEFEETRFREVCEACALEKDIKTLKGGVNIEIGEKGINLSGGQKYRVQLARACYKKDSDIFLFDDPLAAVDSHVGSHIMEECFIKYLHGKTRIVVTHQIQYLEKADWVVYMKEGTICEMGRYDDLMKQEGEVFDMVEQFFQEQNESTSSEISDDDDEEEEEEEGEEQEQEEEMEELEEKQKKQEQEEEEEEGEEESEESEEEGKEGKGELKKKELEEEEEENEKKEEWYAENGGGEEENELIQKEEKQGGIVHPKVFWLYIKSMGCYGCLPILFIVFSTLIAQGFITGADWFLAEWSEGTFMQKYDKYCTTYVRFDNIYNNTNGTNPFPDPPNILDMKNEGEVFLLGGYMMINPNFGYYDPDDYPGGTCPGEKCIEVKNIEILWDENYEGDKKTRSGLNHVQSVLIYAGIALIGLFLGFFRDGIFLNFGLSASATIHKKVLSSLLRAPMSFFDTTPVGRIMNRFSNDLQSMESKLLVALTMCITMASANLFMFVLICYLTRGIGIAFVFITIVSYVIFYFFFRRTNLELKRITSVTKSPILSLISESLEGMETIRAYNAQERFHNKIRRYINLNNRAFFLMKASERWMGVNITFMGLILVICVSSLCIVSWYYWDWEISISHLALAISYSIVSSNLMFVFTEQLTIAEVEFNSVERLAYYTNKIPEEAPKSLPNQDEELKKKGWPSQGKIEFKDYSMRYRDGLPLVLKTLNFVVNEREKIGICGRTGSGKSSVMLSLFRLIESSNGSIEIDGVDISTVGMDLLRSSISIIPQDPVLFSGTIRSNIDPFKMYTDTACWNALEKSRLKKVVKGRHKQLSAIVKEGGDNFSVGERQLICLARAMLKKSRILVLDECTASIDLELDEFIQRKIREEFKDCTILTIAHRINTIIDYDRILVLEKGEISEFNSPKNLIIGETGKKDGIFRNLVRETGKKNETLLIDLVMERKNIGFGEEEEEDVIVVLEEDDDTDGDELVITEEEEEEDIL